MVVGLGNPGESYRYTRHNLGWMVLQQAADRWSVTWAKQEDGFLGQGEVKGHPVLLLLPLAWMNQAGVAVRSVLQKFSPNSPDLIVVHDDLDLSLGMIKIKTRGGAGGHNGLRSVLSCLETEEFSRIKVGIGRPQNNESLANFVLSPFLSEEWEQVGSILPKAVDALECLICEGPAIAMNRFHVRSSETGL
ncbi:aminoacyl-tRNA hydrolase [Candidatus Nitrospira allomarina]|uniref:Peptidyl-tRNA hydrolase n=1 Tax=Candidatus Nitrospira allomarina TaxID=3020900 RepID=A0AA96JTY7_9BACT|nr:aminoacyl-tRNA hydrolase [Candidatus Nitrospira allomarina]WNM60103.1 aminoacyl-tRNA hydrolase [Candidatus Nitrospira allomarina]